MTWPRFDASTQVLVQGMTGKEGARMAAWMIASGTNVVAGITPGKGGQEVDGRPIFNAVQDARKKFPDAQTSCVVVPGGAVLAAIKEGIEAGVTAFHILTEHVPVHDVLAMRALAAERRAVILGPSSVGYLQFPRFRLGYLGGEDPFATLHEGGLAILSASGGMANETLMACSRRGIDIRLAMAVGGDAITGLSLIDAVNAMDERSDVTVIAVFVEPGNALLRALIDGTVKPHQPLVLCLPGDALETLPRGLPYGHAGTVLGEDDVPLQELRRRLADHGFPCVDTHEAFVDLIAQAS
jgi:succinyl-CoA synthetase alpha subunit